MPGRVTANMGWRSVQLDNHLPQGWVMPEAKLGLTPGLQGCILLHPGVIPAQQLLGGPIVAPGVQVLQQR